MHSWRRERRVAQRHLREPNGWPLSARSRSWCNGRDAVENAKKLAQTGPNMSEWVVFAPTLAASLAADFRNGPILDDDGRRFLTEETVANLDGLKIQIFSNEHPPPHFRVEYAGETANFSIKDCSKLNGGLTRWDRNIRRWHASHKSQLIEVWNRTRPSDCPVGEYRE